MRVVISALLPDPAQAAKPPSEPPVMLHRACGDIITSIAALVRIREIPFRTAGKDGQALSVFPALAPALPKKPAPSLL
jgi:hypothetical protein